MTSGLKTGRRPSELELERVTSDECLKDELFGVGARVTLDQLKEKFLSMDSEARSRKNIRVAFVYLLAGFLMAQEEHRSIVFSNCHGSRVVESFSLG